MFFFLNISSSILKVYRAYYFDFRRYFRRSGLSAFYKIGVLKTSAKFSVKHICTYVFSIKLQTFSLKF